MSLLFCKIYDELNMAPDDLTNFRTSVDEPPKKLLSRIEALFLQVKQQYSDVFKRSESIILDPESLRYVVGELQNFEITKASRDAIGDAFEVFIGPAVRGEEGQFFTPRNVVQMMVKLLDPEVEELVIDPACGSGGFLIVALEHIWDKLEKQAGERRWSAAQLERQKREIAMRCMRGLDKDSFLTKVTKAYMAIIGDGRGGIFCEYSLGEPDTWSPAAQEAIRLGTFDVVLTNSPFGSKIKVKGAHKLHQYRLARKWRSPRRDQDEWIETTEALKEQSPQILFIERCIQLLRPGGRMAIVLPESVFGMPNYSYVVNYLYENFKLRAFVSLPEEVFQPYTHAKTCVVILETVLPRNSDVIEMAIADWCGHDSRGNPTVRRDEAGNEELLDDIPNIAEQMKRHLVWG